MKINEIESADKKFIGRLLGIHFKTNGNLHIDDDGFVSCDSYIELSTRVKITKLPVKFLHVGGYFDCDFNTLKSLEGCPETVGSYFSCSNNDITSLKGCPRSIVDDFYCEKNKLTSLEGGPDHVGSNFICNDNYITSLIDGPKTVNGNYMCFDNDLTTLEGAPDIIGGNFACFGNHLTSLQGCPRSVGASLACYNNHSLTTLAGISSNINQTLYLDYSAEMPLMRALVARNIHFTTRNDESTAIQEVLNKYAGQGKSAMMKCASELLTLGKKLGLDLRQNARW